VDVSDRHNGKVSRGGLPPEQSLDEVLHQEDGDLGSFIVGALSVKDPRHSNFAALGKLVRAGVGAVGIHVLGEALRRPGKHQAPVVHRDVKPANVIDDAAEQRRCAEWEEAIG
jgi:hypothetical protein